MDRKKATVTLGVIFGLYLVAFAFFCFVISIAIAIAKDINFTFAMFVSPVLGVATIVGACLLKKCVIATRVIYTVSTVAYVATLIFFATVGLYSEVSLWPILFIVFAVLGIAATVFAYLVKTEKTETPKAE